MNSIFNLKRFYVVILALILGVMSGSCDTDELEDPSLQNVDNELALTISDEKLELNERFIGNELGFNWSSGTNRGTGAAIEYTLEIDHAGNDFSDPLITLADGVKNQYSAAIDHGTLNHRLLNSGLEAGNSYELEARLTAEVTDASVEDQVSKMTFSVTPYKPVSSRLFIVGDASPNGWNISNAAELTSGNQRGVFIYEGKLSEGNFKFAVSRDDCWCQDFYTKHPDNDGMIVYNEGGSGEDVQWTISEEGNYRLRVDLLNKTIEITPVEDAPFSSLYIVGDATESGWNIDNPASFTQSELDPFVFNYEGNFAPGEFKIFAGPMGDWCGDWYRPQVDDKALESGAVIQAAGCEPDNTWLVTDETVGRYRISLNTATNTIRFTKVNLHIVGDAGPNGWNINNPAPMEYVNGDFVYTGPLKAGELKFSKYQGDWCDGEWINSAENGQSITNTEFITTFGCDGPDNKWKLSADDAGDYEIRINLDTETMTVTAL
ncbi:SusF/SusE family outer membrane protein [Salinimicrobium xinjiangense]|uniref:SusF/SusE family outer membrane protein n=1 Tax=Salinimicrobium xinjiangense TaxID=438596 RepID=UPI00040FD200|nr:SusF/SusE family outer membrane protein [Salinimicrobium xinjiangense]